MKIKINKILKLLSVSYLKETKYIKYYRKLPIIENTILLDSQHGNNINGNIFYLLKELVFNKHYENFDIYLMCEPSKYKKTKRFLENKNIKNINIIKNKSVAYYKIFAQAKFLFTDTSFPTFYIKKQGQVVLNVWHGTPLKTLGRSDKSEFHRLGNIQRNFSFSNYLLYPSEYMMEHMIEDYMLSNICNSKILLEGYPRNEIFFDKDSRKKTREELGLLNKEVFVYMPTWRGLINKVEEGNQILKYLIEIEKKLKENQILFVNLHPFVSDEIDYKQFSKIKPFPITYETYEFLNIADCLVTDYSSVFFDFANTSKKIILFAYDKDEYFENRGLYINFNELPFPKVTNVEELIIELNLPKNYEDKEFLNKFCKYDNRQASKRICQLIINNNNSNVKIKELSTNNKPNVLIYPGNLDKNGITTSLLNLLKNVNLEEENYYITYITEKLRGNKDVLLSLPKKVNYIPILGKMNMGMLNKVIAFLYSLKLISIDSLLKYVKEDYELEIKRLYGDIRFDTIIQFNGYDYKKMILYSLFDANRVIYVHNDMYSEIFVKGNQRLDACKYAYEKYDKVALVTEDLIEPTSKILEVKGKFYICNNMFDYNRVLNMSKKEISFDEETVSNIEKEELETILNNKKITKIIAIGRYSKEKGNDRLLEAFEMFWEKHKDTHLIIIGGYGKEYDIIFNRLQEMECRNNVSLIKSISNPYSILNKCDALILPSRYEGFGLVIIEADVLNKPVVSTEIVGPSTFMKLHNGRLVESSIEGIKEGLELLYDKKIKPMNVDYEEYNKNAINQFYKLLK